VAVEAVPRKSLLHVRGSPHETTSFVVPCFRRLYAQVAHRLRIRVSFVTEPVVNVLFLCTGNSARSILAESLLNHRGRGRFKAFSAGSHPKGEVHPIAIALLKQMGLPAEGARSKSWDEFEASDAPHMHFVITVCDNAAGEMCPIWPGKPMTAHWGIPDPAAIEGSDSEKWEAFRVALRSLDNRILAFTSLPVASLDHAKLKAELNQIGRLPLAPSS
jgi:arsenate reductase (thioredoxin)